MTSFRLGAPAEGGRGISCGSPAISSPSKSQVYPRPSMCHLHRVIPSASRVDPDPARPLPGGQGRKPRAAAKPRPPCGGSSPATTASPEGQASAAAKGGAALDGRAGLATSRPLNAPAGPSGPSCGRSKQSLRGERTRDSSLLPTRPRIGSNAKGVGIGPWPARSPVQRYDLNQSTSRLWRRA